MRLKDLCLVVALFVPALSAARAQTPRLPADSVAIGRRASAWFIAGQMDSLMTLMPRVSAEFAATVRARSGEFRARAGSEASLIEERWVWRGGVRHYLRVIDVTGAAPEPIVLRWAVETDGTISGFGLGLLSGMPPVDSLAVRK